MSKTDNIKFDNAINILMKKKKLIGLSISIIQNGEIIKEKGYGYTDKSQKNKVSSKTLFQAGSISKPVATLGVLHLVENGYISLDEDLNFYLRSWKIPKNKYTKANITTLREVLTHSAGFTVHGFPGYATTDNLPSLIQVLDGLKPANTSPIRVDIEPGKKVRYSGGGFTVMQQAVLDITGLLFPEFMSNTVLKPLGMTNSTFEQPPPKNLFPLLASGYYNNGREVKGHWHIYPEMAAAGLWSTASDLACFVIGILQQVKNSHSNSIISKKTTKMMITPQKEQLGLGLFLSKKDNHLSFFHGGCNIGFDSFIIGNVNTGHGLTILINKNVKKIVFDEILKLFITEYDFSFLNSLLRV